MMAAKAVPSAHHDYVILSLLYHFLGIIFSISLFIFRIYLFCVPDLVWDFPRLQGIDTLIKFLFTPNAKMAEF